MRSSRFAAGFALAAMLAACGVPTGPDSFEEIAAEDVPNRLNEATTTTTTTTTTMPPTPPTSSPDQFVTTTTTDPLPPTEFVDIFFISRGELRAQTTEVIAPTTPNDLILLLEAGPASDLLDNEIQMGLIETTSEDSGVLTIELDDLVFRRIPARDQLEAIAQMVLTFLNNLAGAGQVVFTIDDDRLIVPIANGQSTAEPVSRDDYAEMLVDADVDPPTTSSEQDGTSTTEVPDTTPGSGTEASDG